MSLPAAMLDVSALVPRVLVRALVFLVLVLVQAEVLAENEFSTACSATA